MCSGRGHQSGVSYHDQRLALWYHMTLALSYFSFLQSINRIFCLMGFGYHGTVKVGKKQIRVWWWPTKAWVERPEPFWQWMAWLSHLGLPRSVDLVEVRDGSAVQVQ